MENNHYTVSFIDDKCKNYFDTLDLAAKAAGIELFAADNVIEGLGFLSSYSQTKDAVILNLGFSEGELLGREALQRIKSLCELLMVILLSESDTAP